MAWSKRSTKPLQQDVVISAAVRGDNRRAPAPSRMSVMGGKRTLAARCGEFAERLSNNVERLKLRHMALDDSGIGGKIFRERLDRSP
jgi:hypothetical protein